MHPSRSPSTDRHTVRHAIRDLARNSLIPSDKIAVKTRDHKTKILLLRVGEKKQGVVGLFQPGLPGEQSPGLSVRFMASTNERWHLTWYPSIVPRPC